MTYTGLNTWLKSGIPPVENSILYRDMELCKKYAKNRQATIKNDAHLRQAFSVHNLKVHTREVLMPDDDLASLGTRREHGVAYICGDFVEVCTLLCTHVEGKGGNGPKEALPKDKKDAEAIREANIKKSAWRAAKQIRRLVNTNRCRYMWTLTFAPPSSENAAHYRCVPIDKQRDYDEVRMRWKAFLQRFRRSLHRAFRWILVLELHDSQKTSDLKRGTWHLHFATPDRLEWEDIMHFWTHGHVRFDDFCKPKKGVRKGQVRNPGAYMSKYIGKNFRESNYHKKRYTRGRNTVAPKKISLNDWLANHYCAADRIVYSSSKDFKGENGYEYHNINITYQKV